MKCIQTLVLIIEFGCFLGWGAFAQQTNNNYSRINGLYLGQKPPVAIPEIFAPGIISLGYHEHRIAISPDGTEIYFKAITARAFILVSA